MKNKISGILLSGVLFLSLTACSVTDTSTASNSREEANTPEITQEELTKITKGMELKQVIKIIGGEGKQQGESGKTGTKAHQVSYVWDGTAPNSFVSISFRNNKVSTINAMNIK
ncbi:hypothetical protein [Rossellomorea aquimaris]|uniref:DUF3862 domain-containing protein n=1 Tax=Rossellomorea aquimaris TaxID=189382 RepID=A0A1J6WEB2_9BACI|nr:hypothetical protein [Rossellomorea aquimaris]OIU66367.1 hypothetical protein BHE18_16105 [Rossellomorea aquimaris]